LFYHVFLHFPLHVDHSLSYWKLWRGSSQFRSFTGCLDVGYFLELGHAVFELLVIIQILVFSFQSKFFLFVNFAQLVVFDHEIDQVVEFVI
jgi:hypothetical protein